jgi:hypothetical protein
LSPSDFVYQFWFFFCNLLQFSVYRSTSFISGDFFTNSWLLLYIFLQILVYRSTTFITSDFVYKFWFLFCNLLQILVYRSTTIIAGDIFTNVWFFNTIFRVLYHILWLVIFGNPNAESMIWCLVQNNIRLREFFFFTA